MTGNCKVWLNSNAARTVNCTPEPFPRRRRSNTGRPYYRLCANTFVSNHHAISVDGLNRLSETDIDTKRHHVLPRGFRQLLRKCAKWTGRHIRKDDVG